MWTSIINNSVREYNKHYFILYILCNLIISYKRTDIVPSTRFIYSKHITDAQIQMTEKNHITNKKFSSRERLFNLGKLC